jgi:hypothetical protein
MRGTTNALALVPVLAWLVAGCSSGSIASPTFEPSTGVADTGAPSDAGAEAGFAVCPAGMDASFGSIYGQMLSTASCGVGSNACHSTVAASGSGVGNLMDFSLEAGAVYAELLGPDGGGQLATNLDHPGVHVLRVAPGDAGASMLYLKLTITSENDPSYGSGMPLTAPGSVCPAAIDAVQTWINNGASPN